MTIRPDVVVVEPRDILETKRAVAGQEPLIIYEIVSGVMPAETPRRMGFVTQPAASVRESPTIRTFQIGIVKNDGSVIKTTDNVWRDQNGGVVTGQDGAAYLPRMTPVGIDEGGVNVEVGQIERRVIINEAELPPQLLPRLNKLKKKLGS